MMYLQRRVLFVWVLIYLSKGTAVTYSESNKTDNRKLLHRHLFHDYDSELLPVFDNDQSVNVTYGFSLNRVVHVNERSQWVAYKIWFRQSWTDKRLKWNKTEFGGLNDVVVSAELVWRPDIRIYEILQNEVSSLSGTTQVRLNSNGRVQWLYPNVVRVGCKMNVMPFPFDQQCCTIRVGSRDLNKVNIYPENSLGASLKIYVPNGAWDIASVPVEQINGSYECCPGDIYQTLVYKIRMRRRFDQYVLRLILPAVSICILSLFGFFLPHRKQGRVPLALTCLLTMFVFYQRVAIEIPPTNQMPYIGLYISIKIIIMVFNAFATMASLYFYNMGTRKPVPKLLDTFIQKYLSIMKCQWKTPSSKEEERSGNSRKLSRSRLNRFNTTTREVPTRDAFNATVRMRESPYEDLMTEFDTAGKGYHAQDLSRPSDTRSRHSTFINGRLSRSKKCEKPSLASIMTERYANEDMRGAISEQWQTFALVLDRVFFLIFSTIFVLTSLWYIIMTRGGVTEGCAA